MHARLVVMHHAWWTHTAYEDTFFFFGLVYIQWIVNGVSLCKEGAIMTLWNYVEELLGLTFSLSPPCFLLHLLFHPTVPALSLFISHSQLLPFSPAPLTASLVFLLIFMCIFDLRHLFSFSTFVMTYAVWKLKLSGDPSISKCLNAAIHLLRAKN